MDNIMDMVVEKGLVFAVAVVAVFLVGYFVKTERDDRRLEFQKYRDYFELVKEEMMKTSVATKSSSANVVQTLKLEFGSFRVQLSELGTSFDELRAHVTKETNSLKAHSIQIHERSEQLKQLIDEAMEKVGRVLALQEKVDMAHGRVTVLEAVVDRTSVHHRSNMTTIAEKIGKLSVEVSNLKKGGKIV